MLIKVAKPFIKKNDLKSINKIILSGNYSSGKKVEEFEKKFSKLIGTKFSVAVNSGTAAIQASLASANIQYGDEVIAPSLTFFSTISAIIHQGAKPVLVDVCPINIGICINDFTKKITKKTKAIIVVHYLGNAALVKEIMNICKKKKIFVIEDCAQSIGTKVDKKNTGAFGDCGAFSFFATKHITTFEGGIVTTNNKKIYNYIKKFRSHGMIDRNNHEIIGYNYRMNEVSAQMGLVQLKYFKKLNKKRIEISKNIISKIKNIKWLSTPLLFSNIDHTFFWLPIYVNETMIGMSTQNLVKYLKTKGIETRNRYIEPLNKQLCLNKNAPKILKMQFRKFKNIYSNQRFLNCSKIAGKIIGLPNRPDMSKDEINYLVKILKNVKTKANSTRPWCPNQVCCRYQQSK